MIGPYVDRRCGGKPRYSLCPPKDGLMRIPETLLNTTIFLGGKDEHGQLHYRATAFLVGMPSKINIGWSCLVTARHNIVKATEAYGNIYVRINTKDGAALDIEINETWAYPEADSADVAVIPFGMIYNLNPEVLAIPHDWFVTQEVIQERGIGPGDDLIVMGLFSSHVGTARNLPIVRSGNIASMPHEPLIDPNTGDPYDAYLAEVRSIGGLSGSPVFVQLHSATRQEVPLVVDQQVGGQPYYLLGLIRGHWKRYADADFSGDEDFGDSELVQLNTGVAIVTPIAELLPIFETKRFRDYAEQMDGWYGQILVADAGQRVEDSAVEDAEFESFDALASKLVQVPKSEIDEQRAKE